MQTKDIIVAILVICVIYFAHTNFSQLQEKFELLNRENTLLRVFVPTKSETYPVEKKVTFATPTEPVTSSSHSPFPPREDEKNYGIGLDSISASAPLPEQFAPKQDQDTIPREYA